MFKVFVERLSTPMYTKNDEYHFEYIHSQPSDCRAFSISLVSSIVYNCHNCADHQFLSVFSSTHSYIYCYIDVHVYTPDRIDKN